MPAARRPGAAYIRPVPGPALIPSVTLSDGVKTDTTSPKDCVGEASDSVPCCSKHIATAVLHFSGSPFTSPLLFAGTQLSGAACKVHEASKYVLALKL